MNQYIQTLLVSSYGADMKNIFGSVSICCQSAWRRQFGLVDWDSECRSELLWTENYYPYGDMSTLINHAVRQTIQVRKTKVSNFIPLKIHHFSRAALVARPTINQPFLC